MASFSDRAYFPPLEECLKGDKIILSWRLISEALSDPTGVRQSNRAVVDFFKDPYVLELLLHQRGRAFEPPSPQTRADFETKTAAVNLTPTPAPPARYDAAQIKEDALWLSRNVALSEAAALRVVAVEFQARARSHLEGPLSAQDAINLQEALGGASSGGRTAAGMLLPADTAALEDADTILATFGTTRSRRRRLIGAWLAERRGFYMAVDYTTSLLLHGRFPVAPATPETTELRAALMQSYGIASVADVGKVQAFRSPSFIWLIDALESCQTGSAVLDDRSVVDDDLDVLWLTTDLLGAIHGLSAVFQVLDAMRQRFMKPQVIVSWFKFANEIAFFDRLPDLSASSGLADPLRCLTCAISLTLLNLPRSIAYLRREADLDDGEVCYLNDSDTITIIHDVATGSVKSGLATASPAAFAWSLILHAMFTSYQDRAEKRDLQQNQAAQAGFEMGDGGGGGGGSGSHVQPSTGRRLSAGSVVSLEAAPYDAFLSEKVGADVAVIESIGMSVTANGRVYDVVGSMSALLGASPDAPFSLLLGSTLRLAFLDFLNCSFGVVGYISEPVSCLLTLLEGGQGYWDMPTLKSLEPKQDVLAAALADQATLDNYIFHSLNRFPYEYSPFINMCRILATCQSLPRDDERADLVLNLLTKTPTITFPLPAGYQDYVLTREDEEENLFTLTADLPLLESPTRLKRLGWHGQAAEEDLFTIPAGAYGRFVSDSGEVCQFQFNHSALAMLGKRLEHFASPDGRPPTLLADLVLEEACEAVSLLATLIRAETLKSAKATGSAYSESALNILAEASRAMLSTKDAVEVVCDILDTNLQKELSNLNGVGLATMMACIQFLHAIIPVCPSRVWAYLAKSDLLNNENQAGRLSRITGSLDLAAERYDLVLSSVRFFSAMVDSAASSAVQRRTPAKADNRHEGPENLWASVSQKILAQVCLSIVQTCVDVFENSATWRFASDLNRSVLIRDVVPILDNSIRYSFTIGGSAAGDDLMPYLRPSAMYVVEAFLSPSSGSLRFEPLLATLLVAFYVPPLTIYPERLQVLSAQLAAVAGLATTLVRAGNHLDHALAPVERRLFKATPLLARLCAVGHAFRAPALTLLDVLVKSAGRGGGGAGAEPPSLLGYLSPQASRSFLRLLSTIDRPFNQPDEVRRVWGLFATIVRNRQQWMSTCLVTGKVPREAAAEGAAGGGGGGGGGDLDSVLTTALDRLAALDTPPPQPVASPEALALLDFVAAVQSHMPRVVLAARGNAAFVAALGRYARDLKPASLVARSDPVDAARQTRIAAYIAEAFAMQLYQLRQMGGGTGNGDGEAALAAELRADLDYYLRHGVEVGGYNASLHANFARNFADRFPCGLESFQRTDLEPRALGDGYVYSLPFADMLLRYDASWLGPRGNGFKSEMEKANANLSLVAAQKALFDAWEFLLLELSGGAAKDDQLIRQMWQVAEQCLTANETTFGPGELFGSLPLARAELALTLVQRLADTCPGPGEVNQLLGAIWTAINRLEEPFGASGIAHHRVLLRLLYVTLRAYNLSPKKAAAADAATSVALAQTMLNLLDRVVAHGFRDLVTRAHDPGSAVAPADVDILTAILQAALLVPGVAEGQAQIVSIMESQDVLRVATSLFSWSDRLVVRSDGSTANGTPNHHHHHHHPSSVPVPVFAEPSLLFLLELSSVPALAEQLACDGLLDHLASANLSRLMQSPGVDPLSDNPAARAVYAAWARGLLPLLLNILAAVGPSIAPDVAGVLARFPRLLRAAGERLEAPGASRIPNPPAAADAAGGAAAAAAGAAGAGAAPAAATPARNARQQQAVTLLSVTEVHSLALIARILAAVRSGFLAGGAAAGIRGDSVAPLPGWDPAALLDNVEFWLSRRQVLRDRIWAPPGSREAEWKAMRPQGRVGGRDGAGAGAGKAAGKRVAGRGGGGGAGFGFSLAAEPAQNLLEEKVVAMLEAVRAVLSDE